MPTTDAQGRTISDDGHYWWDGSAWQLIQRPAGKGFLDSFAESVEGAVKRVEGSQSPGAPNAPAGSVPPPAPAPASPVAPAPAPPVAPAPAPPAVPAIPAADLLAYLGALKGAGMVTDAEHEQISKRIQAGA